MSRVGEFCGRLAIGGWATRQAARTRHPGRFSARVAAVAALVVAGGIASAQARVDARLVEAIGWYTGVAGRVDDPMARSLIDAAARDGDVLARMWVARAYSRGRLGYPRDETRAGAMAALLVEAVRRQAGQGSVEAVFLMGTACDEGLGVAEDPAQAFEWFQKAAAEGHTLAEHNIGNAYAAGRGVAGDDAAAITWWTKAALKGDAVPQLRLGQAYEQGKGAPADLAEAKRWYAASAARGNPAAVAALERLGGR
jgi:TPR repeat protein